MAASGRPCYTRGSAATKPSNVRPGFRVYSEHRIAALPGVEAVAMTSIVPMDDSGWRDPIFAEDKAYSEGQIPPLRTFKFVTPGLFKAMGNRVVAGRDFTWDDLYGRRNVAIVSENLARELWRDPGAALGKRIRESTNGTWREIVGVVSDERENGVDAAAPTIAIFPMLMANFVDEADFVRRAPAFIIRSGRAGSSGFVKDVSQAVWSVNPNLPLAAVRTQKRSTTNRSRARPSRS